MKINKMKVILAIAAFSMVTNVHAENEKCIAVQKAFVDYSQLSSKWCALVEKPLSQKTENEIKNSEKYCERYKKRADKTRKRMFKECKNL